MSGTPQLDFWKRQAVRRLPPAPERRLHIAIADRLRADCNPDFWWSHIASGELRTKETAALLQRMGLKPGMSDFLFIGPNGQHHWLELKRDYRAPLSEPQEDFLAQLRRRSVPCAVGRNYDSTIEKLKLWGVL